MTDLAKLVARLELQSSQFQSELEKTNKKLLGFQKQASDSLSKIERQFKQFGKVITGAILPAIGGAAFANFIRGAVSSADAIGDAAERAGVLASELSRLKYVADQSDVSFESLTVGIKKLQDNVSNAALGTKASVDALGALNLKASQLKGIGLENQLATISERFRRLTDEEDKTRVALDLFGKSGADLIPLLNRGRGAIQELAAEADRLGITLDDRAVASIDRSSKALSRFWEALKGGTANLVGDVVADLFGLTTEIEDLTAKLQSLEVAQQNLGKSVGFANFNLEASRERLVAETAAVREQLAALKEREEFLKRQSEIESARRQAFGANRRAREEEQAEFLAMINASQGPALEELSIESLIADREAALEEANDRELEREREQIKEIGDLERANEDRLQELMREDSDAMLEYAISNDQALMEAQFDRVDEVSEYEREAQRRTQNIISTTLRNGFDDGFDGALESFVEMLRDMAIEAAAANLAQYFTGSNSSGSDGFWAGLVGAVGAYFGGGTGGGTSTSTGNSGFSGPRYASGGSYPGNQMALVGENGPELFMSKSAGTIIPNDKLGGTTFAPVTYITIGANNAVTREEVAHVVQQSHRATMKQVAEANRRGYPR